MSTVHTYSAQSDVIRKILKLQKNKRMIVTLNNLVAAEFIDKSEAKGLKPGEDYQLLSFDDTPAYFSYNISSLRPSLEKVGELFGHMICDKGWIMKNGHIPNIRIQSEYIERRTFKLTEVVNRSL